MPYLRSVLEGLVHCIVVMRNIERRLTMTFCHSHVPQA